MPKTYSVIITPEAEADLFAIYTYIADRSGRARAGDFVERIEAHCQSLRLFPERGTKREPETYKLSAWYNTNRFADPFFSNGVLPTSTVLGRRGDWSIYGASDQLIYRPKLRRLSPSAARPRAGAPQANPLPHCALKCVKG